MLCACKVCVCKLFLCNEIPIARNAKKKQRIKNETKISSGATSVSYAAVRYILDNVDDLKSKKILLFGAGKIGRNTCENLIKHTQNKHITLINRTKNKAEEIAGKFDLTVKDYANIQEEINQAVRMAATI